MKIIHASDGFTFRSPILINNKLIYPICQACKPNDKESDRYLVSLYDPMQDKMIVPVHKIHCRMELGLGVYQEQFVFFDNDMGKNVKIPVYFIFQDKEIILQLRDDKKEIIEYLLYHHKKIDYCRIRNTIAWIINFGADLPNRDDNLYPCDALTYSKMRKASYDIANKKERGILLLQNKIDGCVKFFPDKFGYGNINIDPTEPVVIAISGDCESLTLIDLEI